MFFGEDEHGERVLYDALGHVRGGCAAGVAAPPLASIADPGVRLIRGSLDRNEAPPPGEAKPRTSDRSRARSSSSTASPCRTRSSP